MPAPILRLAIFIDIGAAILSTIASFKDKNTDFKFRPFEFSKGMFVVAASTLYFLGLRTQNIVIKSAASLCYMIQSGAILADGIKEKDRWMQGAGVVSVVSSLMLALVKTKI